MDISNTLWFCFICAGLSCLRTILSQRLRGQERRLRRATPTSSQFCIGKQCSVVVSEARLFDSGSRSSPQAPTTLGEARTDATSSRGILGGCSCSCECSSPVAAVQLARDGHVAAPVRIRFDCAACSDAGSASSSLSSSRGDSDVESEGCRGPSSSADCSDDDERRNSPVQTLPAGPAKTLRPAIRSPRGTSAPSRQAQNPAGEQRKKTKTVTFNTGGVVICSPPTAEALDLLAAGTPPLPVMPQACGASSAPPSPSPTSASSSVLGQAASRTSAPDTRSGYASEPPFRATAAPATSCAATARAAPPPVALAPSRPTAPPAAAMAPPAAASPTAASAGPHQPALVSPTGRSDTLSLCTDPVHASALARAAEGRRRVMAALEEAKSRHAHLGRSTRLGDWPAPATGGSHLRLQHSGGLPERGHQHLQHQQCGLEVERSARLPNLPLACRDLGILAVGYAPSCSSSSTNSSGGISSVASAPEARRPAQDALAAPAAPVAEAPAAARQRPVGLGGAAGLCGAGAAAALSGLPTVDRLRLAEAMAKQSLQLMSLEGF